MKQICVSGMMLPEEMVWMTPRAKCAGGRFGAAMYALLSH